MSKTFVSGISSSFQLEVEVAKSLCETVDSPRSLAVWLLLHYGEYKQYLDLSIDSVDYDNPSNFADDYLVTEVLRKNPDMPVFIDRREAALSSFWISELRCFATNQRLLACTFDYEHVIRKRIAAILGPVSREALDFIESHMGHGPGSTASLRSRGTVPSDKYRKQVSMTIDLLPYYKSILGPLWHSASCGRADVILGSKFTTVPKNAKTDRGIAAEPTLNMFVQKGIGKYIRERLRRSGLDLKYQSRNQLLAQRAWRDSLATIDLSAASDSLATGLVLSFLPPDWVELLSLCRSHRIKIDGDWHELEKFSSMGNGYTFELESLIFYSICTAIVPRDERDQVGVYGDDIVIPSRYSDQVVEALNFLGFEVNVHKSFLAGCFYESCGADFFKGIDVRPFYLKGNENLPINGKDITPYALRIANRLRLYSCKRLAYQYCDSRFRPLWVALYSSLPLMWRKCKVPPSFGDLGVITSINEARVSRSKDQWQGYKFKCISFKYTKRSKRDIFVTFAALQQEGLSERPSYGREPIRGYLGKPFPKQAFVSHWPHGLAWLT